MINQAHNTTTDDGIDPIVRELVRRAIRKACAPPSFEDFRNARWDAQMQENFRDADPSKLSPSFLKRVRAVFPGMDHKEITDRISKEPLLRLVFAKDPAKQSLDEEWQRQYLQEYVYAKNIVSKCSQSRTKGIYLTEKGELEHGVGSSGVVRTKALDFYIRGLNTYIYAKHTSGEGGAQDNQRIDVEKFILYAKKYCELHNDDVRFIALLDGTHYEKHMEKYADVEAATRGRVRARTCDQLAARALAG